MSWFAVEELLWVAMSKVSAVMSQYRMYTLLHCCYTTCYFAIILLRLSAQ